MHKSSLNPSRLWLLSFAALALVAPPHGAAQPSAETSGGWLKSTNNPVLGGSLGTCFDISVLKESDKFRMWFSWRPKRSLGLVESADGIQWSEPKIVLGPNPDTDWEKEINRPVVLKRGDTYHLWYTGQTSKRSWIGYATSQDGVNWTRMSQEPVLTADSPWEKNIAVMCPHVIWDEQAKVFRMWYSGGEQYEPNAIGYATSPDGLKWTKHPDNPIFTADKNGPWEQHKVTACQVIREGDWHVMLYIGFADEHTAQIGLARSRDGITGWERHPQNPIIRARVSKEAWDYDACYKPYAIFHEGRWLLWYNGRKGGREQIGLATHEGRELWPKPAPIKGPTSSVLRPETFKPYVENFSRHDEELYVQHINNAAAWDFLRDNIPLFECPDKELEEIYYFRWWTYRKHLKQTTDGFVITEFLPKVGWAGKHNTISCPAGHHFYEGRWLREPQFLDDYAVFWFRRGGEPRRYSFWAADALWSRHLVHPNRALLVDLLPDLIANYAAWEKSHRDANGLFWQIDDRDGMEVSIGGSGYRATINSYMFGDALAIARIADLAGKPDVAREFRDKAAQLKQRVQAKLWDDAAEFYKVLPRGDDARLADVRELHGYTPWYFGLPDPAQAVAWRQLIDPQGFYAPYGPTTTEQRHPKFTVSYTGHECQWNGPSWPFSTTVTLTALANLLNGPAQDHIRGQDYFDLLKIYAKSHRLKRADGRVVPWIDENLNPLTGDWLARTRLKTWKNGTWDPGKGGVERGKDYNHSTFCDLIISGLVGLRPRADEVVEVNPLAPAASWEWFCLDGVAYHGRTLTIVWDNSGQKYGRGAGLRVLADGQEIARAPQLQRVSGKLPERFQGRDDVLDSAPAGSAAPSGARPVPATTELGIQGTQFTLNGTRTFLYGISYYGALGAPEAFIRRDLADMREQGFNWIRVWATWSAFDHDVSAVDGAGNPREPFLTKLKWLVAECDREGVVVDVTLSRGNGVLGAPRLQTLDAHRRAVETLVAALKPYRNWYLDLANEREVRDRRFVSFAELKELRAVLKRLDSRRPVTASAGGDISRDDLREYLQTVQVDFVCPHRPRNAQSPARTEAKTREYLAWMQDLGRFVPVHYQEPFRRGYGKWQPQAEDYVTDARGAKRGGAAGWCFHNGPGSQEEQADGNPRRSFDLREKRLFEQLDKDERKAIEDARGLMK